MNWPNTLPLALGLLIFSFLVNSVLTIPFIDLLYKLKLTRKKEASKHGKVSLFDKLHDIKAGTPIGGGILMVFMVTLIFALSLPILSKVGLYITSAHNMGNEILIIAATFLAFGFLGFLDDIIKIFGQPKQGRLGMLVGLTGVQKFFMQWVLALFIGYLLYAQLGIRIVYIPLVDIVLDLGAGYIIFAAFVIVSFSNAFNITDGLDGLASGLLMICLFAFWIIAANNLDTPLTIFISIWIGALIAFLYFNVYPARIFLGDTGSLSFGATLAVIGLLSGNIIALVVIGGVFVVEVASSLIQIFSWRFRGKRFFPLAPFHNTLLAIGWEEPKIVMRAWLAGLVLALFGLWLAAI